MPKPKIVTLEQLKQHVDAHAEKTGSGFTFDKFRQAMEFELSVLKMSQQARCNYETMKRWRNVYFIEQFSEK